MRVNKIGMTALAQLKLHPRGKDFVTELMFQSILIDMIEKESEL